MTASFLRAVASSCGLLFYLLMFSRCICVRVCMCVRERIVRSSSLLEKKYLWARPTKPRANRRVMAIANFSCRTRNLSNEQRIRRFRKKKKKYTRNGAKIAWNLFLKNWPIANGLCDKVSEKKKIKKMQLICFYARTLQFSARFSKRFFLFFTKLCAAISCFFFLHSPSHLASRGKQKSWQEKLVQPQSRASLQNRLDTGASPHAFIYSFHPPPPALSVSTWYSKILRNKKKKKIQTPGGERCNVENYKFDDALLCMVKKIVQLFSAKVSYLFLQEFFRLFFCSSLPLEYRSRRNARKTKNVKK